MRLLSILGILLATCVLQGAITSNGTYTQDWPGGKRGFFEVSGEFDGATVVLERYIGTEWVAFENGNFSDDGSFEFFTGMNQVRVTVSDAGSSTSLHISIDGAFVPSVTVDPDPPAPPLLELTGMSYWLAGTNTVDSQQLPNQGTSSAGSAQFGSTSGSDSNDPTDLPWTSADGDYARLPGTSGNYLSHPDSAAVSVTGDITIQVECALDDWINGATQALVGKYNTTGSQKGPLVWLTTSGQIQFYWSEDGSTDKNKTASVIPSFADGQKYWIRVTLDVDNGASDADVRFYTSTDGESWSQLGTTQAVGATTSIYDNTATLYLGTYQTGSASLATGSFYSAYIWDSDIGDTATSSAGTPVMHWEASSMTQSGGADEESGSSWTINRSASGLKSTLVTRPVIVFNSAASTYLTVADHDDLDMGASDDFTVWVYFREFGTSSGNSGFVDKQTSATGYRIYPVNVGGQGWARIGDGVDDKFDALPTYDYTGNTTIVAGNVDRTLQTIEGYSTPTGFGGSPVDIAAVGDTSNAVALSIGSANGGGTGLSFELFGAGVLKGTSLSAEQLASLKTELDTLLGGRSGE